MLTKVKRSAFILIIVDDKEMLDVSELVGGQIKVSVEACLRGTFLLTGKEYALTKRQLSILLLLSIGSWTTLDELVERRISLKTLEHLADIGALVTDDVDPTRTHLREQEEKLKAVDWEIYSSFFHFMTKWKAVEIGLNPLSTFGSQGETDRQPELPDKLVDMFGAPPDHFFRPESTQRSVSLPAPMKAHAFFDLLRNRRTTRCFDLSSPLPFKKLATILYYTYGCHGLATFGGALTLLKKTSPSGGALHPTEAFLLLRRVDGLSTGLYHYDVQDHGLNLLRTLSEEECDELSLQFTGHQTHFACAHALVVNVTRFRRNFWKYRYHKKAYRGLIMDVGHISQTFYLVCTTLKLGAFVTCAINEDDIERAFDLDPLEYGVISVSGCGLPGEPGNALEFQFEPYSPTFVRDG